MNVTKAPAPVTSRDLVAAMFHAIDEDLAELLPLAEAELPAVLADNFNRSAIWAAAKRMAARTEPAVAVSQRLVDALGAAPAHGLPIRTIDAIGEVQWSQAHAAFVLGLVMGQRLGGAR